MTETLRRGYPGMKSVKDMPVVQDGPPPGGFPSVRIARRIPSTGPGGFTVFAVSSAIMAYGFYLVGQTNHERRAIREEKQMARLTLVPILQAEEDRRWVEQKKKFTEQEAQVMQNVRTCSLRMPSSVLHCGECVANCGFLVHVAMHSAVRMNTQVPGWKAGESVYSGGRFMPPAKPVGIWGEYLPQ